MIEENIKSSIRNRGTVALGKLLKEIRLMTVQEYNALYKELFKYRKGNIKGDKMYSDKMTTQIIFEEVPKDEGWGCLPCTYVDCEKCQALRKNAGFLKSCDNTVVVKYRKTTEIEYLKE